MRNILVLLLLINTTCFGQVMSFKSPVALKVKGAGEIGKGSDLVTGGNPNDLTMHGTGKVILGTGGLQRLVITNAGNVGVGTPLPLVKFEVSGLASFRYNDGKQSDGKYLRSNSTGITAWDSIKVSDIVGLATIYAKINTPTIGYFQNIDLMNPYFYAGFNYAYSISTNQLYKFIAGNGFLADDLESVSDNIIAESSTIDKLLQKQINSNSRFGLSINNTATGNNSFTGTNTFLTPIFANSTSTTSYSSITGSWNNTGNLGVFSFLYNTKVAGNTVNWSPIRMDYNGFVGIGMDPTQSFEVLGAAKFNSSISASSLNTSGVISGSNLSGTNTGDNAVNNNYSGLAASKQAVLNGTGFIKSTAGTITYDNSTYLTSSALSTYATQTALSGKENSVSAGTTTQFYRGDKTWQTIDKTTLGLTSTEGSVLYTKIISNTGVTITTPTATTTSYTTFATLNYTPTSASSDIFIECYYNYIVDGSGYSYNRYEYNTSTCYLNNSPVPVYSNTFIQEGYYKLNAVNTVYYLQAIPHIIKTNIISSYISQPNPYCNPVNYDPHWISVFLSGVTQQSCSQGVVYDILYDDNRYSTTYRKYQLSGGYDGIFDKQPIIGTCTSLALGNTDSYIANIEIAGTEIGTTNMVSKYNGIGSGRTNSLSPIVGRYTNSNLTAKAINLRMKRNSADESLSINNDNSFWIKITEILR